MSSRSRCNNKSVQFITNKMCPFAQKAWIALEVSQTPYVLKEVSLYGTNGKPAWFMKFNPAGTVPVIETQDGSVYADSELILDYVHEMSTLHSQEKNIDEAKVRKWRKKILQNIIPIGKKAVLGGSKHDLFELLKELDDEVEGPFLCGETVTIADCAAFPFLWRINDEFGLEEGSKLKNWLEVCEGTKCFKTTIHSSWWWWW